MSDAGDRPKIVVNGVEVTDEAELDAVVFALANENQRLHDALTAAEAQLAEAGKRNAYSFKAIDDANAERDEALGTLDKIRELAEHSELTLQDERPGYGLPAVRTANLVALLDERQP